MALFGSSVASEGDQRKYQRTARIEMDQQYWETLQEKSQESCISFAGWAPVTSLPLGSNVVIRTACCSVWVVSMYSTFKAIEKKDQDEQQRWLIYWADYGSFSLVEAFADKLVSWVPMYYHVKFAFLVWLQLPCVDGAKQLYKNHLRPFFLRHQARVDLLMGFTYGEMVRIVSTHQAEIEYATAIFSEIAGPGDQKGNSEFDHSGEHLAIEGETGGETGAVTNSQSDSDD